MGYQACMRYVSSQLAIQGTLWLVFSTVKSGVPGGTTMPSGRAWMATGRWPPPSMISRQPASLKMPSAPNVLAKKSLASCLGV